MEERMDANYNEFGLGAILDHGGKSERARSGYMFVFLCEKKTPLLCS